MKYWTFMNQPQRLFQLEMCHSVELQAWVKCHVFVTVRQWTWHSHHRNLFFTGLKLCICKHSPNGMSHPYHCPWLFFAGDVWHNPGPDQDHILAAGHQRCVCCRGGLYTQTYQWNDMFSSFSPREARIQHNSGFEITFFKSFFSMYPMVKL